MANDGESKATTDYDRSREWVEERGGRPARVEGAANEPSGGDESRFARLVSRDEG